MEKRQPEALEPTIATESEEQPARIEEKQYYTVKQIAIKFGYTSAWISYLCKIGKIKAIKLVGGDWRIPPEEYNKIVREGIPASAKKKPIPPQTIEINVPLEEEKETVELEPAKKEKEPKKNPYWPLPWFPK